MTNSKKMMWNDKAQRNTTKPVLGKGRKTNSGCWTGNWKIKKELACNPLSQEKVACLQDKAWGLSDILGSQSSSAHVCFRPRSLSAFLFPLIAVFAQHMFKTMSQDIDNCYGHIEWSYHQIDDISQKIYLVEHNIETIPIKSTNSNISTHI